MSLKLVLQFIIYFILSVFSAYFLIKSKNGLGLVMLMFLDVVLMIGFLILKNNRKKINFKNTSIYLLWIPVIALLCFMPNEISYVKVTSNPQLKDLSAYLTLACVSMMVLIAMGFNKQK